MSITLEDVCLILEQPIVVAEHFAVVNHKLVTLRLQYVPLHQYWQLVEDGLEFRCARMEEAVREFNRVVQLIEGGV